AFQSAKQPLDLVAPLVHFAVVLPGLQARGQGWHDRDKPQIERQLPGLVALVRAIHDQVDRPAWWAQSRQHRPGVGGVMGLPRRERERYGRSSIRGNHMNLGCPSASGLADGLRAVFFRAPVPSGWTFTIVLSTETASILMRTICSCCIWANTRSRTPFFDQRFMRV